MLVKDTRDEIWNGSFDNYRVVSWGEYARTKELIWSTSLVDFHALATGMWGFDCDNDSSF